MSVCHSGRLAIDDAMGDKLTVIGLAVGRLKEPRTPSETVELLRMVTDAVWSLEAFLGDLGSCHVCKQCDTPELA